MVRVWFIWQRWHKEGCLDSASDESSSHFSPPLFNVPVHSDDTGWLVTVDQYYVHEVNYILDTVVARLLANPDRKFICMWLLVVLWST